MTVGELQSKMTGEELKYWIAYNQISPIGPERLDYNFAQLSSILVNTNRTKGKGVTIDDMILKWGQSDNTMVKGKDKLLQLFKSIPLFKEVD